MKKNTFARVLTAGALVVAGTVVTAPAASAIDTTSASKQVTRTSIVTLHGLTPLNNGAKPVLQPINPKPSLIGHNIFAPRPVWPIPAPPGRGV